MTAAETVRASRERLGRVGVFLGGIGTLPPAQVQRQALAKVEGLGYGSAWTNEGVGGKDVFAQLGIWLAATERIVVGSSIANMWARAGQTMHGGAAVLAEGYPGRLVLGIGSGYPEQAASVGRSYERPVAQLRSYLDQMDAPPAMLTPPEAPYPRLLAAVGPKMLALAGEHADGAIPASAPPEYIARAREILGQDKLLIAMVTVVVDTDRQRAKDTVRTIMGPMLSRPQSPYVRNLLRLGFTADEITQVGDRVLDALVAYGDEAAIAKRVREYFDAGADHVILGASLGADLSTAVDVYERLAPAVLAAA